MNSRTHLQQSKLTLKSLDLSNDEIKQVSKIHQESINLGFLSQLGPGFLYYLYQSIDKSDGSILIVAKNKDKVIGFVTGTNQLKAVYSYLLKHYFIQASLKVLPHVFSYIKLKKILELLSHTKNETADKQELSTELLSLAVNEEYRGTGIAKDLFLAVSSFFKKTHHTEFKIIVGNSLVGAQKFYSKMGAVEIGTIHVHKGSGAIKYLVKV
jgi:ribosomal protein S18 acetylase RimI-like enzyme